MEREILGIKMDVVALKDMMEKILSNRDNYRSRHLPEISASSFSAEKAYISYAPSLEASGMDETLLREIETASAVSDYFSQVSSYYRGWDVECCIASKNGYSLYAESLPGEKTARTSVGMHENHDFRERPWYQLAQAAKSVVTTGVYRASDGDHDVVCAVPYHYGDGSFAGVVGISSSLASVCKRVMEAFSDDNDADIHFILSAEGEVIFSTASQGTMAVSPEHRDMRKARDVELAREMTAMAQGKTTMVQKEMDGVTTPNELEHPDLSVALVTVDEVQYYLAYVPIKSLGWSCGVLVSKKNAIEPANSVKEEVLSQTEKFIAAIYKALSDTLQRTAALLLFFMGVLIIASILVSRRFVRPILALTDGVRRIEGGNLDEKLSIETGNEVEDLAVSVNNMTEDLKSYMVNLEQVTAEKERIAAEVETAEGELFVNGLLHYSMSGENPDKTLRQMVEYLGSSLGADRAYIFERMGRGSFDITYEWRAEGVLPADRLLDDSIVDIFYKEHEKSSSFILRDIEECRKYSEDVYRVCKANGIRSLVTAPLFIEGEYSGFFGVDNPPLEKIDEIAQRLDLTEYFISTVLRQKRYLREETERLETELDNARKIQASMLPSIFPAFPERKEIDVHAIMIPAKEVGGDFYDLYELDERHIAFTIADVSGKGIPAALFMVIAKTILKNQMKIEAREGGSRNWAKAVERANRELCEGNREKLFVTMILGVLDRETGEVCFVNAGHNKPLVGRWRDGRRWWSYVHTEKQGFVLGVFPTSYEMDRLFLGTGDVLFLYTDGVTESMNGAQELYGEERLQKVLDGFEGGDLSAHAVLSTVHEDILNYAGDADQFDDITMLALRFLGKG